MHNYSLKVSRWIQYQIVSRRVLKKRAAMYKFFVMLGDEFRKLQNYNGILQVTSALGATAVHRLTKNMVNIIKKIYLPPTQIYHI